MLKDEIKLIKSDKTELRKFGLSVGIVLGLIGGLLWWREKNIYQYFLFISLGLIFLGLLLPSVLKPLQKAWMTFAVIMGWFMTRVILTILFFVIVTPISLISRLFGKHFLEAHFDKSCKSYWVKKDNVQFDQKSVERQF